MDDKTICNLGLGKISASRVSSLSPPRTPIEKHCSDGYAVWRDSELTIRTWKFALRYKSLTQEGVPVDEAGDGRIYKFALPNDCLRPIRDKHTIWEQRGKYLWTRDTKLILPYVARVPENDFDALFVDVLACRVGRESVEFATQSNTKEESIETKYNNAVNIAAKANAFVIGPEDIRMADENSEWIYARWGMH